MKNSDPILLTLNIEDTLKRYIPTTLGISHNYPKLQQEFLSIIEKQKLVQGPYLEALPDFEKGHSLAQLLDKSDAYLHDGLRDLPENLLARPLHLHQEIALELACRNSESFLVATGTGSGKTETFLYPAAHRLLDDPDPDLPGVRILIIYPMNALANDQLLYRIAPLFGNYLKRHNITFGRYTSQIRANASRDDEEAKILDNERLMDLLGDEIPANWLLTREEMLKNPPKILLTNYAMLEHLLLLPRNAALFKHPALKSIILDEIHTYSGAQATEVAFLLRKLKNRLGIHHPLQVFGTSASLSEEKGSDAKLIKFASSLFGEKVDAVVRGKRQIHTVLRENIAKEISFAADKWIFLDTVLTSTLEEDDDFQVDTWNAQVTDKEEFEPLLLNDSESLGKGLFNCFKSNAQVRSVATRLGNGLVLPFRELAVGVFPGEDAKTAEQALGAVVHVGMVARQTKDDFPLLPGRYHIAANGIEGVCLSLDGKHAERWGEMRPFRFGYDESGKPLYPLMVCRRCGQPFVEGFLSGGFLYPSNETGGAIRKIFWLGDPKNGTMDESDEDSPQAKKNKKDRPEVHYLNPKDGIIFRSAKKGIKLTEVQTQEDDFEKRMLVKRCPSCGTLASGGLAEVITHMHPGNEAMSAVVCQQIMDFIPPDQENCTLLPMGGRGLLTFSDNRQDAAFFAPYFERTGNDLALRSAAYHILKSNPEEVFEFEDLATEIRTLWKKEGQPVIIDGTGRPCRPGAQHSLLVGLLAAEFCTPGGRRTSLESLGAVSVVYEPAVFEKFVKMLKSVIPTEYKKYSEQMGFLFLEHIRREKAITAPNDGSVDMSDEAIWGKSYIQHRSFEIKRVQKSKITHAWLASSPGRFNRRTWFLTQQLGWTADDAESFLSEAWNAMRKTKLLVTLQPGFGLDSNKILLRFGEKLPLYRCNRCGLTSHFHIAHKCTAFRCEGELVEISADELAERNNRNHYMAVMKSGVTKTLRAREHTASLSQEIRQEIEQNFAAKKINLLSCTTTMEMGVDLGDLEAVACLNIPPGISNYQQRTGRAGRRAQAAPFCVTLAKNSRYDQAVFNEFCDYLASPAHVPCIHLANAQLFQRHQYSVLLSGFLLHRIQDLSKNAPSLAMFLGEQHDEENHLKFIDSLQCWLESEKGLQYLSEATALKSFLPTENGNIGLAGQTLIKAFVATMERFSQTCCDRWSTLNQKKKERLADNDLSGAARWERQQKKFMGQLLVTRLSCHGIIPTYSFPVHSLSLEVIKEQKKTGYFGSADIELSRNAALGISEYSPGCRIVANGRIWTSAGLAYSPRQFMPEQVFLVCPECNHVETNLSKDDLASECPFCGNEKRGRVTSYIEPLGFVTDYKERSGANPGQVRPRRMYADEARLISQARDDDFHLTNHPNILKALLPAVGAKGVEAGRLFIVNKGPNGWGFHRCSLCNRMEPAKFQGAIKVEHTDIRSGKKCGSRWMSAPICLAHEFTTDIAIFRFTTSLPIPKQKAGSQFFADQKNMATTLSEAMRFAASEILHVKDSEIRGSFKIRNGYADILLYDDVPGGAGYAQKLQDVSIQTFLQKTMERLICPDNCSTACRKCLCDYSNQNKWPRFNRKPVLRWLKSLVGQKKSSRFLGAEPWPDNSLAGIDSRLVNFRTIHITGTSLVSSETDPEGPGMRWLLSHLHEGRTVHCHLSTSTPYRPSGFTSSERRCWNKLRDAIQHEKIVLSTLDIKDLPRIFPDVSIGVPAFYSEYAVGAFLDNPLPKPAFISILDDSQSGQISKQLKASIVHASTIADDLQPRVIQLIAGQKRDIKNIFSPLDDAYLRSISVFDPYCGTKNNIESTEKFLTKIDDIIKKCEKINIHCKEINYKDFNYEFPHQTEVKLNEIFDKLKKIDKLSAKIVPFLQGKKFHDRWIICEIYLNDGSTMKHRFDLSGGIDLLLDESKSTKVYHYIDKNIH